MPVLTRVRALALQVMMWFASDLHPVVEKNKLVEFADDFDLIIPGCNVDSRGQETG